MELYKKTAVELSGMLKAGEISAEEVVKDVLHRTEQVEKTVGAYITRTEDMALSKARDIDKKRAAGETLSDLAGIPVAIKDNICTEGVLTTCASRMLYNFVPPYQATVMEKLHGHDVVVTGKTNLDEFASPASHRGVLRRISGSGCCGRSSVVAGV